MDRLRTLLPVGQNALELLEFRATLTKSLIDRLPYCILTYLLRSVVHHKLQYSDLCASDAYRALNLLDFVRERIDEGEDYDETDLGARIGASALEHTCRLLAEDEPGAGIQNFLDCCELIAICLLSRGLRELGCVRDSYRFLKQGLRQAKNAPSPDEKHGILLDITKLLLEEMSSKPESPSFQHLIESFLQMEEQLTESLIINCLKDRIGHHTELMEKVKSNNCTQNIALIARTPSAPSKNELITDGEFGYCRREVYPWNIHEPDRLGDENIAELNGLMGKCSNGAAKVAVVELPVLGEAKDESGTIKTNKQLGVYATRDIKAGETFFKESSFVIGVADPYSGLFCDFCSIRMYKFNKDRKAGEAVYEKQFESMHCDACLEYHEEDSEGKDEDEEKEYPAFCSTECLEAAQNTYHKALCGKDLMWLYSEIGRASSARYMWLLMTLKVFGTSISRNASTESSLPAHPLEMLEVKSAWGTYGKRDFSKQDQSPTNLLPFSFELQIQHPLRMLHSLDIDPYSPEYLNHFDTWVINTLYAKYLGTASSRLAFGVSSGTGAASFSTQENRPEATAMHLSWSMVNHSCSPNVVWECEGTIMFTGKGEEGEVAVKAGEEILQSYCDIGLPVKERREWMKGSLGGNCMCERCLREESQQSV